MSRLSPRFRTVLPALISLVALSLPPGLMGQEVHTDTTLIRAVGSFPATEPTPQDAFQAPLGSSILGGTLGSGAGMIGGALLGYQMASCGTGEWFCGFGEAAVGGLLGSVVGSTVGANLVARHGGASPTFGSTFLGGMAGVLTGLASAYLVAQVAPDGPGALLGFAVGQGVVTGLLAARRR